VVLDYAILCEAASAAPDGKTSILGGGFDIFVAPKVPFQIHRVVLAARFLFRSAETNTPVPFEIRLIDGDGQLVLPSQSGTVETRPGRIPGAIVPYPMILEFAGVTFHKYGPYSFEILIEGRAVKSVPLYIVDSL